MPSNKVIFINVTLNDTIFEEKRYSTVSCRFRYGGHIYNLVSGNMHYINCLANETFTMSNSGLSGGTYNEGSFFLRGSSANISMINC